MMKLSWSSIPFIALVLSSLVSHARAACGDPGQALFNTNGLPKGKGGELWAAIRCLYSATHCNSASLIATARGVDEADSSGVVAIYGASISNFCTSEVKDFSFAFADLAEFNEPLDTWNTAKGVTFSFMFANAIAFNQSIGNWDLSRAVFLTGMFSNAKAFNSDIGGWSVKSVKNFNTVFANATSFNQDLGYWDVSGSCTFKAMFLGATGYNQDLNAWGNQLLDKTCNGNAPTRKKQILVDSGCPVKTLLPKRNKICQVFNVETCLEQYALETDCSCAQSAACYSAIYNTPCRKSYLDAGNAETLFAAYAKSVSESACAVLTSAPSSAPIAVVVPPP